VEQVRLGDTGLWVSPVWLGMMSYGDPGWRPWVLDESDATPFVEHALDLGITTFDTADVYSRGVSEEVTGRLLLSRVDRDQVVIATKVFMPMREGDRNARGLGRKHLFDAIDASLRRLGTDHVDLWQIHRWDPHTPIEETMEAMHDIVRSGRVRYIGASSMHAWQFAKAQHVAAINGWTPFVSMQPHYNLLYREEEREMLPQCLDMGVGVVPWSPLARGRLARPPGARDTTREQNENLSPWLYDDAATGVIDAVGEVAERRGVSRAQVAAAWVMRHPAVTAPIVGATKLAHLDEAAAALDVALTDEDVDALEADYVPRPVLGHQ
jgi:aryl-alcohol dehydrogenase-like predicted oxidoreductase